MSKVIKTGEIARDAIIKGVDTVADLVKMTVGPKGRNVIIRELMNPPIITNDGVTIAKSIELKDKVEDTGAQLMIQVANKTNEVAGDGTTTTTILAQEMIHKYFENYENNKQFNVVQVQKDMINTANEISDYLLSQSVKVTDTNSIEKVATISSGNKDIAHIIAQAFEKAGEYGSVIVEDSKTGIDNFKSIDGMRLTNGSVSQFLFNDKVNQKTDMVDVNVLVTTDKLDSVTDLIKIYDYIIKNGKKLLIICDDIETEPLNMTIMNKARGALSNIAIIGLPGFGELRENLLNDICLATGATLIGRDQGSTIKDFEPKYLGELEQVTVTADDTVLKFIDTDSYGEDLLKVRQDRVAELEKTMENVQKEEDKEQYKRRIANLLGGIITIEIGGNTEVEVKDKKLRVEDALNSVQSAIEEGIVPGGGYSFLMACMEATKESKVQTLGQQIVYESLFAVTRQIAENAGYNGNDVVTECIEKQQGFNALTGEYENLLDTGVINSVKVDRFSLINATSVASTVITMGGVVTDENEKDQNVLQLQTALPVM